MRLIFRHIVWLEIGGFSYAAGGADGWFKVLNDYLDSQAPSAPGGPFSVPSTLPSGAPDGESDEDSDDESGNGSDEPPPMQRAHAGDGGFSTPTPVGNPKKRLPPAVTASLVETE